MNPSVAPPVLEHHEPGRLGVGDTAPRVSWRLEDAAPGAEQLAAEIQTTITAADGAVETAVHRLDGDAQILVPWPTRALRSGERAEVRVRVRLDGAEDWTPWSGTGWAEVGCLEDWGAQFVGPGPQWCEGSGGAPGRVRREFEIPAAVRRARLHITAHGLAEAEINGRRVGDEELTPGWSSYRHRLRWATFDVTEHLADGANAIGVRLGDGWWRGRLGFGDGLQDVYGDRLSVLARLEVTTVTGEQIVIVSDEMWQGGPGPILRSGLYDGEHIDLRREDPDWSRPGWAAEGWTPVVVDASGTHELVAPPGPPVRCTQELAPVTVERRDEGRWILDFGQNHSGRLRVRVDAPAGTVLTLRHAEVLVDGELHTEPLRSAEATDRIVCPGGEIEIEPRFTVHGYRYAEVSGWPGELRPGDVVSRVLHSDMRRTGWFRSSDPLLERLHENVVWSLRSNFVDLPTDCPQRDERLGWTGDLQVFAPAATFLYDVTGMLGSWLDDLAAEQHELDWVPPYVPYLPLEPFTSLPKDPMALWGDAAVLVPYAIHRATGDAALVARRLSSARAWMEHVERAAGEDRICRGTEQLGDWLDPAAPPENPFEATTDRYLVATAYFAHSARRLAVLAEAAGDAETAERMGALGDEVAAAYARRFLPGGRPVDDTQTAHALTTVFDLWPDEASREAGTARLAELVREAEGRIATGFAGTPAVCDALARGGHLDEAYLLLMARECPSWLYTVLSGGTTTWERWDSLKPDGTVNSPWMTSFNHYALGAVADWMHRTVAGIAADEPGYRRIRFAPRPGGGLTSAGATHLTPYGAASIDWRLDGDELHVRLEVPPGTTAVVDLPGAAETVVGSGSHDLVALQPAHRTQSTFREDLS